MSVIKYKQLIHIQHPVEKTIQAIDKIFQNGFGIDTSFYPSNSLKNRVLFLLYLHDDQNIFKGDCC